MAKWNYTLRNSRKLRDAIDTNEPLFVIMALKDCYKELEKRGLVKEYEHEDLDIYGDDPNIDDADYELCNFYDLCDGIRVWIEL